MSPENNLTPNSRGKHARCRASTDAGSSSRESRCQLHARNPQDPTYWERQVQLSPSRKCTIGW